MLVPGFLVGTESLDGFDVDGVESVDNFDLSDNTNGSLNFIFGLTGFGASFLHELDELPNFVILSLDLLEHTFGVLFVIIAFLGLVLKGQLKCFQFKLQFLVFRWVLG